MAYITKEEVKVIRDNLKKSFPEIKFSVRKNAYSSTVYVVIKESPYNFELNGKDYRDVNQYHYDTHMDGRDYDENIVKAHNHRNLLRKIFAIISAEHWDKSDAMTDYFNCAFYYYLSIGEYTKPYRIVARKAAKSVNRVSKVVIPKSIEAEVASRVEGPTTSYWV